MEIDIEIESPQYPTRADLPPSDEEDDEEQLDGEWFTPKGHPLPEQRNDT